jgi:hypothetical protein
LNLLIFFPTDKSSFAWWWLPSEGAAWRLPHSQTGFLTKEARAAAMPDPRQAALKRKIAEIRARAVPPMQRSA